MGVSAVHTLGPHPPGDGASISGEAGDGDSHMVIDGEDLLLVGGEVARGSLEGDQHGVSVRLQGHGGGALLHSLHGVLNLEKVSRKNPTTINLPFWSIIFFFIPDADAPGGSKLSHRCHTDSGTLWEIDKNLQGVLFNY